MKEQVIIDFCNEVMSTRSITDKKRIVASYSNNDTVKLFLKFLFDKQIVTGISNKKLKKDVREGTGGVILSDIENVMHYLTLNSTGTDSDIVAVQNYLARVEAQVSDITILEKIVTKSLKLGIDTKLINTAIPQLIPVHEVQQAIAIQNATLKDGEWFCLSQKLNGNRATFINHRILSRQGKEFSNIDHIIDELDILEHNFTEPMVYDGEIIRKNVDGVSDNENFRIGTGILNSDDEDKTSLSFVIFDILPLAEFRKGQSKLTYKQRYALMQTVADSMLGGMQHIGVVPFLYAGTDRSMIDKCLAKMDSEGKEGCMLARDVPYMCKRHNGLLKVKSYKDCSLRCVGIEVSDSGKHQGIVGALVCEYGGSVVKVGSGLSDIEREHFALHPEEVVNKIVDVKYKDLSHNKSGRKSLQFPVFLGIRHDKSDPDSIIE